MIRTRSPLSPGPKPWFSLDLHVLGAPPAFVLSQDQTLHQDLEVPRNQQGSLRSESCRRRSLTSSGNFVPPRTLHYSWFVYDTELTCGRCRPVETGDSYRTGFRLSLLCFQEAALRRPHEAVVSKGHASSLRWLLAGRRANATHWVRPVGPRARKRVTNVGVNRSRRSGPKGQPACGARRKTTDSRRGSQTM